MLLLVGCGLGESAFLVTQCGDLGEWDSYPRGGVESRLQNQDGYLVNQSLYQALLLALKILTG